MKKSKIKELIIVISIILTFIIALLLYGFLSTKSDPTKTPDFQKFVMSTNFPIDDYIYSEEKKSSLTHEEKEENQNNENKKETEETVIDKVKEIKDDLLKNKQQYTNDIFPSNEEIALKEAEQKRKSILTTLINDIPTPKVEKNNFKELSVDELEFGDSYFTNRKTKNSVSNETKLFRTITADKKIPVILTSSIISTLSGQVTGLVEEDIYASMGTAKLIPKGSRAIGTYENNAQLGENRFGLKWDRFITPHGININLENAQSADLKGNSGIIGEVDDRYWERYGLPLTLSTISNSILLAISQQTASSDTQSNANTQIVLDNSRQDLSYIMKNIIDEQIKVRPLIRVQEASRVFIVPKYDIWFPHPKDGEILVKYFNKKGEVQ